ncbi:MAG TPA: hypothetical protein PLJ12_15630, partial [Planctomycetota bacterium]|nr:hypothetical protein [Planctomycetota bacterium]
PLPFLALLALNPASPSQDPTPTPQQKGERPQRRGEHQEGAEGKHEKHNKLEDAMDGMKDAQRALRGLLADPATNQKDILRALLAMESACATAFAQEPPRPEAKLSDQEWALYVISFKSSLLELQRTILDMQANAWKNDAEALKKGYEALNADKKKGHDKFKPEDE